LACILQSACRNESVNKMLFLGTKAVTEGNLILEDIPEEEDCVKALSGVDELLNVALNLLISIAIVVVKFHRYAVARHTFPVYDRRGPSGKSNPSFLFARIRRKHARVPPRTLLGGVYRIRGFECCEGRR
jgi:hypothetical protein